MGRDAENYIQSWNKNCPDYELMLWNESNFDIQINSYVEEAYVNKKWAFVSDYARLWALKKYGGIYLDTDVEVIKSLDRFLNNKAFIGAESRYSICTAVIGAERDSEFINDLLNLYNRVHFINENKIDVTPNSQRIFEYLSQTYNYKESNSIVYLRGCTIYPREFFSPINCYTLKQEKTNNTYCIHKYAGTWKNKKELRIDRMKALATRVIGEEYRAKIKNLKKRLEIYRRTFLHIR